MRVEIRAGDPQDVDGLVAFGFAVVPPHYAPILGDDDANAQLDWWTPERIRSAIEAGRVHLAVTDDAIVGVSETGELAGEQVIWKLYLAPGFRGRSLGRELLHHAIASLPENTGHVDVEHFAGNAKAGRFYQREGFRVIKTDRAGSGEPDTAIVWRRLELGG